MFDYFLARARYKTKWPKFISEEEENRKKRKSKIFLSLIYL